MGFKTVEAAAVVVVVVVVVAAVAAECVHFILSPSTPDLTVT
jgi:hypothetical protein